MKISLIKELNNSIKEKDEFERALEESGYDLPPDGEGWEDDTDDEFSDDAMDSGTEEYDEEGEYESGQEDELRRIADAYRPSAEDMGQGSADEMSDDELRDAIGNDLEQLDYSPEEIAMGIDEVMAMLGRG